MKTLATMIANIDCYQVKNSLSVSIGLDNSKDICHFLRPTQTFRPSEMSEDPTVHPPTLKDPVTIQSETNSHGPYVLRDGGSGRVSLLRKMSTSVSVSWWTSSLRTKRRVTDVLSLAMLGLEMPLTTATGTTQANYRLNLEADLPRCKLSHPKEKSNELESRGRDIDKTHTHGNTSLLRQSDLLPTSYLVQPCCVPRTRRNDKHAACLSRSACVGSRTRHRRRCWPPLGMDTPTR